MKLYQTYISALYALLSMAYLPNMAQTPVIDIAEAMKNASPFTLSDMGYEAKFMGL